MASVIISFSRGYTGSSFTQCNSLLVLRGLQYDSCLNWLQLACEVRFVGGVTTLTAVLWLHTVLIFVLLHRDFSRY